MRTTLGDEPSAQAELRAPALAKRVTASFCGDRELSALAGSAEQERPLAYEFSDLIAFANGFFHERIHACTTVPTGLLDTPIGGDMARVRDALVQLRGGQHNNTCNEFLFATGCALVCFGV